MPSQASIHAASYLEQIALAVSDACPYFKQSPLERPWAQCERNAFLKAPGVYTILRKVSVAGVGYRYVGLNAINPVVLYVERTSARRSIRQRFADHFGCQEPNFQGSQFVNFLMQIVQDETAVKRILRSPSTLIACVAFPEDDQVLETIERLATPVFSPRFNIKDH